MNAADTTHPLVELGTLLATAVAFFMAVAPPSAFGERALWFAITYVLVRAITCGLWWSYFPRAKPALDRAVEAASGAGTAATAASP